jgi:hypothetical protein
MKLLSNFGGAQRLAPIRPSRTGSRNVIVRRSAMYELLQGIIYDETYFLAGLLFCSLKARTGTITDLLANRRSPLGFHDAYDAEALPRLRGSRFYLIRLSGFI